MGAKEEMLRARSINKKHFFCFLLTLMLSIVSCRDSLHLFSDWYICHLLHFLVQLILVLTPERLATIF